MNRLHFSTFLFSLLSLPFVGFALVSCDKVDGESIVPHFDKITCSPERPHPGDSITLTAHQDVKGKNINATTYNWSFTFSYFSDGQATRDTVVALPPVETNYDGISSADPVIGFRLPTNIASESVTVSLHANYNLTGQTALGQIYGSASRSSRIIIDYQ